MDDPPPNACFPSPFFLLRVGGGVKAPEKKKIIMAKDTIINTSLENVCTHASHMNTHTHTNSLTHIHAHLTVKYTKNRICCTFAVHVHTHIT